jgi:hypothetical protein
MRNHFSLRGRSSACNKAMKLAGDPHHTKQSTKAQKCAVRNERRLKARLGN